MENKDPNSHPEWHALEPEAVFNQLTSSTEGLDQAEAEKRIAHYGLNRLRPAGKQSSWVLLVNQFNCFWISYSR